jgi:hypothetical protein
MIHSFAERERDDEFDMTWLFYTNTQDTVSLKVLSY